jgi:AcrR family transcriptional regulator
VSVLATKGERTRQRLLDIAVERFADGGFQRTSVSSIARQAGLTQAAVYAYFDNKEDLFFAAVDLDAAGVIADAQAQTDPDQPMHEQVPGLVLLFVEALEHHPLARRVLAGHEPEVIGRLVQLPALEEITGQLAEDLAESQQRGDLRPDVDPATLADGLQTLVLSLLMAVVQVDIADEERRIDGVAALFDAVLKPLPDSPLMPPPAAGRSGPGSAAR